MNWRAKLVVTNVAMAAALYDRWHAGAVLASLLIAGVIAFGLVNVLILLTRTKAAGTR